MKIVHLGDLHLGIKFHKRDLLEDQKFALEQIVNVVDTTRASVVIAGDVYDTINPPIAAQSLWFWFLDKLGSLNRKNHTFTLVIDGNHDSASRLALGGSFMRESCIHICTNEPGVLDDAGILCVPHIKPGSAESMLNQPFDNFDSAFKAVVGNRFDSVSNIAVVHQTFEGGKVGESEFKPFMSDAVSVDAVKQFSLVLAGHLHAHQKIGNIWYSGSLLPYAFGDDYDAGVSIFDIADDGSYKHTRHTIDVLHPLKVIKGSLSHCLKQEAANCYVKIQLTTCEHFEDALAKLQVKFPLLLSCTNSDTEKWEADLDKPIGTFATIREAIDAFCTHIEVPKFTGKRLKMIEEAIDAYSKTED